MHLIFAFANNKSENINNSEMKLKSLLSSKNANLDSQEKLELH